MQDQVNVAEYKKARAYFVGRLAEARATNSDLVPYYVGMVRKLLEINPEREHAQEIEK